MPVLGLRVWAETSEPPVDERRNRSPSWLNDSRVLERRKVPARSVADGGLSPNSRPELGFLFAARNTAYGEPERSVRSPSVCIKQKRSRKNTCRWSTNSGAP